MDAVFTSFIVGLLIGFFLGLQIDKKIRMATLRGLDKLIGKKKIKNENEKVAKTSDVEVIVVE